jgi:hypothetical protein
VEFNCGHLSGRPRTARLVFLQLHNSAILALETQHSWRDRHANRDNLNAIIKLGTVFGMLRITTIMGSASTPILKVEGKLVHPWVGELRRVCDELLSRSIPLTLDLAAITYVDAAGDQLLRELLEHDAAIIARSGFVAAVLEREER